MWSNKCDLNKIPWFKFRHEKLLLFSWYDVIVDKNIETAAEVDMSLLFSY